MLMKNSLLSLTLMASLAAANTATPSAVGLAYDQKTGHLLYSERYNPDPDSRDETVTYVDPDQNIIARKRLVWNQPWSPSVEFDHRQTGERFSISVGQGITGTYLKRWGDSAKNHSPVSLPHGALVVDAGFNPFIKDHWQALSQGESLGFSYYLASRGRLVDIRVTRSENRIGNDIEFVIEPANLLMRALSNPIRLTYNDQKQLRSFTGRSNIADAQGQYPNVVIHYEY